jgi:hypothetical protein
MKISHYFKIDNPGFFGDSKMKFNRRIMVYGIPFLLTLSILQLYSKDQTRPPTSAEKEYYEKVLKTVSKALPDGPAGWQVEEMTGIKPLKRVLLGQEKIPFPVQYFKIWCDPLRKRQMEKAMEDEKRQLLKSSELGERADFMVNLNALTAQIQEANERGDRSQAQSLQGQYDRAVSQPEQLRRDEKEEKKIELEAASRFGRLQVTVDVNRFVQAIKNGSMVTSDRLPGMIMVLTEPGFNSDGEWQEGTRYIFAGKGWQFFEGESGGVQTVMPIGVSHTAVYSIIISVQAEEYIAQKFIDNVDWNSLKSLLTF